MHKSWKFSEYNKLSMSQQRVPAEKKEKKPSFRLILMRKTVLLSRTERRCRTQAYVLKQYVQLSFTPTSLALEDYYKMVNQIPIQEKVQKLKFQSYFQEIIQIFVFL